MFSTGVILLSLLLIFPCTKAGWPDPHIRTQGEIWPQPLRLSTNHDVYFFDPKTALVQTTFNCDILTSVLAAFNKKMEPLLSSSKALFRPAPFTISIVVSDNRCPSYPSLGMDESYRLTVTNTSISLVSPTAWGLIRGMESLSQLIYSTPEGIRIRNAIISDAPRFSHRGLLVDTTRHFLSIPVLKAIIELMAQNKLNVFHWHLTDNEAFPFIPTAYPELAKGAYSPNHLYTIKDLKDIVAFSRVRGIRVVPEIDTPGHAKSFGTGLDFMTPRCFNDAGQENFDRAMLDPTDSRVFDVLTAVFKELFSVFPDEFFHLGGDETEYWQHQCWQNNKNISDYMKLWGFKTTTELEGYYFKRLIGDLTERDMPKKKFIVWQEVFDIGVATPGMIGHVWMGGSPSEQMDEMKKVVSEGHMAILSSCWYLDHLTFNPDFKEYYDCDPQNLSNATQQELNRILGGEAAMWGEMVDSAQVIPRIFPRASAVAEKLWSSRAFTTGHTGADVWPRLYEWQCRMTARGFPIQPANGPGYCPVQYMPNLPNLNY